MNGVEEAVNCLAPGTTYHFRLVAVNGKGEAHSRDRTFRTKPWQGGDRQEVYARCPHDKPLG